MLAPLPESARVNVEPSLARELLDAAERLPPYDNKEFYSTELQSLVHESLQEVSGFASLIEQIEQRSL